MADRTDSYNDPNKRSPDEQALRLVYQSYDRSKRLLVDPKRSQWEEWKKAYRGVLELANNDNFTSQLVINWALINVEAILPRIAGATPTIEVWPRSAQDQRRAAVHRYLLKYDWQILNMVYQLLLFAKSSEIYGTAWLKSSYRKIQTPQVSRVPVITDNELTGELGSSTRLGVRRGFKWDDVWVDRLEITDVFPDPDGLDVDSCGWIIHRCRTDLSSIKNAMAGGGKKLYDEEAVAQLEKLLVEGSNPVSQNVDNQTVRQVTQSTMDDTNIDTPDPFKRQVHLLEFWQDEKIITVVEEFRGQMKKPLRNEANILGMKPFVKFCPIPDPESIYGLSIVETVFSPMVEDSLLHSANLDNVLQTVHTMYTVLDTANINPQRLRWRPGGSIMVGDHEDIRQFQHNHNDIALHRQSQDLRGIIERLGTTDTFQGIGTPGATATEASILQEASGSKANLMFRLLGHQAVMPLGRQFMRWNELFIDRDKPLGPLLGETFTQRVVNPETLQIDEIPFEFDTIRPDDLVNQTNLDMDLVIDLSILEPGNSAVRFQRAEKLLQYSSQLFPPDHPVNKKVFITLLEGSQITDNAAKLFEDPEAELSILRQRQAEQGGAPGQENAETEQGANATTEGEQLAAENPASNEGQAVQ